MGRFAGLAGVKANDMGIRFQAGNYEVKLLQLMYKDTSKGPTFIVETEVMQSDVPQLGPGSKPSWASTKHHQWPQYHLKELKQFVAGIFGIPDMDAYMEPITAEDQANTPAGGDPQETANNRFWETTLEWIVSEAQPLTGYVVHLNATVRTSSKSGKSGLRLSWGPVISTPEGVK